jgi:membrane fusion protein (multidrug efflux system)
MAGGYIVRGIRLGGCRMRHHVQAFSDMTIRRALVFVALILAAAAMFALSRSGSSPKSPAGAAPNAQPRENSAFPVYTETIRARPLKEKITVTGSIVADESVELVSEVAGKVVSIAFDEGSKVKQGDVLLKTDETELSAQADRAESRVALARAQAQRQNQLVAAGGTSREALDAAESEVRVLEAEATLARAQLAKTEIRAPFDGVIGLRYVSVGAFINPSARIATLQKVDPVKIEFTVAVRHLERVKAGASVTVSVAGITEPFAGTVYAIEPRIDPATRTLRLRARADNPGAKMLPGGFATVEMTLQEIPNALMVPANAIISGLNQQHVYVLEAGKAQIREVVTGLRLARDIQVLSGLEEGAVVITSGQLQLRPGASVQAVPSVSREPESQTPQGDGVAGASAP